MGKAADSEANGEELVDYESSTSFTQSNNGDEFQLPDVTGDVIDSVAYDSDLVFTGASISLNPAAFDANSNDHTEN